MFSSNLVRVRMCRCMICWPQKVTRALDCHIGSSFSPEYSCSSARCFNSFPMDVLWQRALQSWWAKWFSGSTDSLVMGQLISGGSSVLIGDGSTNFVGPLIIWRWVNWFCGCTDQSVMGQLILWFYWSMSDGSTLLMCQLSFDDGPTYWVGHRIKWPINRNPMQATSLKM